jgi:nitroreductase
VTYLEKLVSAAVKAPSGDNTQPWRFALDEAASRIEIHLDATRDSSPMNAGQRMARIALGAALENLLREAWRLGFAPALEDAPPALAVVRLTAAGRDPDLDPAVAARVTNRRPYDGRALDPQVSAALERESSPPLGGVTTHWIAAKERLRAIAALVGRADATMFSVREMLMAFLAKVRFDATGDADVEDGLSPASLELSAADRLLLQLLPRLPHGLLLALGTFRVMGARSKALVAGSSALCLVVAPDAEPRTDLDVGRATERAWLALTAHGLSAQPMMSLLVLENALDHGVLAGMPREAAVAVRGRLRALAPEIGQGRPAFLMRVGFAPPPRGRVGRRPVRDVTRP